MGHLSNTHYILPSRPPLVLFPLSTGHSLLQRKLVRQVVIRIRESPAQLRSHSLSSFCVQITRATSRAHYYKHRGGELQFSCMSGVRLRACLSWRDIEKGGGPEKRRAGGSATSAPSAI